jgi:hypothetical protein
MDGQLIKTRKRGRRGEGGREGEREGEREEGRCVCESE